MKSNLVNKNINFAVLFRVLGLRVIYLKNKLEFCVECIEEIENLKKYNLGSLGKDSIVHNEDCANYNNRIHMVKYILLLTIQVFLLTKSTEIIRNLLKVYGQFTKEGLEKGFCNTTVILTNNFYNLYLRLNMMIGCLRKNIKFGVFY